MTRLSLIALAAAGLLGPAAALAQSAPASAVSQSYETGPARVPVSGPS